MVGNKEEGGEMKTQTFNQVQVWVFFFSSVRFTVKQRPVVGYMQGQHLELHMESTSVICASIKI